MDKPEDGPRFALPKSIMSILAQIARYLELRVRHESAQGLDLGDLLTMESLAAVLRLGTPDAPENYRALIIVEASERVAGSLELHGDGVVCQGLGYLVRGQLVKVRIDDVGNGKSLLCTARVAWTKRETDQAGLVFEGTAIVLNRGPSRGVPKAVVELESRMSA